MRGSLAIQSPRLHAPAPGSRLGPYDRRSHLALGPAPIQAHRPSARAKALDRRPDSALRARSRGARLLPSITSEDFARRERRKSDRDAGRGLASRPLRDPRSASARAGMGEVYRARDPRLGRDVAIKVLPASFSADADRLRRFEQEAQGRRHPQPPEHHRRPRHRPARRRAVRRPGAPRRRDAPLASSPAASSRRARRSTTRSRSSTASRPRTRRASSTGT